MTKFKVGDRVEATEDSPKMHSYKKGDKGTIEAIAGGQNYDVKIDGRLTTCTLAHVSRLKLINEDKMTYTNEQIRDALTDSVTHWREIVGVFADTKTGDELAKPQMGAENCALCNLGRSKGATYAPQDCENCPMPDKCENNSLYDMVAERATTNHAAWEASKAMLARLEELLAEYDAKAKDAENDIRVGDVVINVVDAPDGRSMVGYSGVVNEIIGGTIHYKSITGRNGGSYKNDIILIHRPAAKGK